VRRRKGCKRSCKNILSRLKFKEEESILPTPSCCRDYMLPGNDRGELTRITKFIAAGLLLILCCHVIFAFLNLPASSL
jgi:hypothetical protein